MLKFKSRKKIVTLLMVVVLLFAMTGNAFAADIDEKYMDAKAVKAAYDKLYENYGYGDVITVTISEKDFKPVLASSFYNELSEIEKQLKTASLPENNIIVEYDANGRIIDLLYPKRFEAEASEYINAIKERLESETTLDEEKSTTLMSRKVEYVTSYKQIPLIWGATYLAGWHVTFSLTNSMGYPQFVGPGSNITPYTGYSGLGSATTNVTVLSNTTLDGSRTCAINVLLQCHAKIKVNGTTQTFQEDYYQYREYYAASYY